MEDFDARAPTPQEPSSPTGALAWRFDQVLDAMREGLQVLDFDLRYLYINAAAAEHGRKGRAELVGHTLMEMYPGVEQSPLFSVLQQCLRDRKPHQLENEFTFPDGSKDWFELRIQPVPEGLLILSVDIGTRKRLEAQLSHAQKMEAIGRLAGGIAHDFNNLLTVIVSYSQLVASELEPNTEARRDLDEIASAAQRGAKLTKQLLALGRRQVLDPKVLSVASAAREVEPMLQRLVGEGVTLQLTLAEDTGRIRVDPGQLDQVLINLVANARDAMPNGGRIVIRSDNVMLDESYGEQHPGVKPGDYVMLAVSDTGIGMNADTISRMFEPFFTTKAPGKGTGLGLATSHGIVHQNGGHIWVYSEVGHGTTFKLYFPRVFAETEFSRASVAPVLAELRGSETLLLVEDDPALRTLCARSLTAYGYTVLEADSPVEALRFSARFSGAIALTVSDVVLPAMSGPALARELHEQRERMRFLFMSGYADHDLLAQIDSTHYLQKPFTPQALARKVREVLSGPK